MNLKNMLSENFTKCRYEWSFMWSSRTVKLICPEKSQNHGVECKGTFWVAGTGLGYRGVCVCQNHQTVCLRPEVSLYINFTSKNTYTNTEFLCYVQTLREQRVLIGICNLFWNESKNIGRTDRQLENRIDITQIEHKLIFKTI